MNKSILTLSLPLVLSLSVKAVEFVDVELQLLIDISGSVNNQEYNLQMDGYQAAFESNAVQDSIISGHYGQIAVQLIMWSGANQQQIMIDWALIDSPSSANDFANDIAGIVRPFSGMTATGSAIEFAYPQFSTNDFVGTSQVIDISGDGTKNSGTNSQIARNEALSAGVTTINGIVITNNQNVIDEYANEIVGGSSPMLLATDNFGEFQQAIEVKISSEIAGTNPRENLIQISEPNSKTLFALAFLLFIYITKSARRKS